MTLLTHPDPHERVVDHEVHVYQEAFRLVDCKLLWSIKEFAMKKYLKHQPLAYGDCNQHYGYSLCVSKTYEVAPK